MLIISGANPKEVQKILQKGNVKGIYQLTEKRLVYCLAAPGKPRPERFDTPQSSGQSLVTLERFSTGEQPIEAKLKKLGATLYKDEVGWITTGNPRQAKLDIINHRPDSISTAKPRRARIDDAALEVVAKLSKLSMLYVTSDSITDAGLAYLTSMKSLQGLEIASDNGKS